MAHACFYNVYAATHAALAQVKCSLCDVNSGKQQFCYKQFIILNYTQYTNYDVYINAEIHYQCR